MKKLIFLLLLSCGVLSAQTAAPFVQRSGALTATRVPFITTNGLLIDSSSFLFTTSANPGAPDRTLKIGSNTGDSQLLIVGGSAAGNTANSFNFELHDAGDVLTQAWVTLFDLGLTRWSTSYWSTLSSAYVESYHFDPATNVTTFTNGLSAPVLTSTTSTGTAPFVVTSTTQVANLNSATAGTATNATNVGITNDTATNATMFPLWATANTGNLPAKVTSTKLTFNPSTGVLSSTSFTGAGTGLTGTASSLTAGNVTTNANLTGAVTSVGNAASLGSFTSANLSGALTNETGTGLAVFDTSPALTTSITTGSTTFALLNTTATTVNAFGGASTALNMGNASGATSLLGIIGFDGATPSSSTAAIFPAGTTGVSSFRIPHGVAPTTPVNGDFWTTSAGGLFGHINGATINYGAATISGLTTTAIVTANGATAVQTPSPTSTMDSSGNMVLSGTLSIGSGATNAGALVLTQGTANSTGTTNITFEPPTSVTSWKRIYPGSVGSTGLVIETVSGTTQTESVGNLTGDITSAGAATTLATVNSNVGSFTNANITVNAKGLITAAANGSGGTGTANVRSITQANSFTIGQCVFNNNGTWTLSDNSAAATAQVDGTVTATGNPFTVTLGGAETTITGLAANTVYYLGTSGAITSTKPTSTTAFLVQVLHTGVAGDGTVEISSPASLSLIGTNDINFGLTADTTTALTVTTAMDYITNSNASAVTDNLPTLAAAIAANPTKIYHFKNVGAGAAKITPNGAETIFYTTSGATSLTLNTGEAVELVATATQWLAL